MPGAGWPSRKDRSADVEHPVHPDQPTDLELLADPEQPTDLGGDRPAVVLVTASWCGPCRPAPTVLRELGRRWGPSVHAVMIEDPSDEVLDQLVIDVLPVWLRLAPGTVAAPGPGSAPVSPRTPQRVGKEHSVPAGSGVPADADPPHPLIADLRGAFPDGTPVRLRGEWSITERHDGALPKHEVDVRFGSVDAGLD